MINNNEEYIALNGDVVKKFAVQIEKAINKVIMSTNGDYIIELLSVLISMASQISVDVLLDKDEFIKLVNDIYDESEKQIIEKDKKQDDLLEKFNKPNKILN